MADLSKALESAKAEVARLQAELDRAATAGGDISG